MQAVLEASSSLTRAVVVKPSDLSHSLDDRVWFKTLYPKIRLIADTQPVAQDVCEAIH